MGLGSVCGTEIMFIPLIVSAWFALALVVIVLFI